MTLEEIKAKLKEPFAISALKWRMGNKNKNGDKALMLVYIDARDVMDRLDEVCGAECWKSEYRSVDSIGYNDKTKTYYPTKTVVCRISIKLDSEWVYKEDGAGNTDFESEKGGMSDAFKRAAVAWGIGRYLYNASDYNTWVPFKGNPYTLYNDNKTQLDNVARQLSLVSPDIPVKTLETTAKSPAAATRSINADVKLDKVQEKYKDWLSYLTRKEWTPAIERPFNDFISKNQKLIPADKLEELLTLYDKKRPKIEDEIPAFETPKE